MVSMDDLLRAAELIKKAPRPLREGTRLYAGLGCIACNQDAIHQVEQLTQTPVELMDSIDDYDDDIRVLEPPDWRVMYDRPLQIKIPEPEPRGWYFTEALAQVPITKITLPSW